MYYRDRLQPDARDHDGPAYTFLTKTVSYWTGLLKLSALFFLLSLSKFLIHDLFRENIVAPYYGLVSKSRMETIFVMFY